MIEFVAKMAIKFSLFSVIIGLISNAVMGVGVEFFEVLTSSNFLLIFKTIDFFVPLPFILGCIWLILTIRYIRILWAGFIWIYGMIFI